MNKIWDLANSNAMQIIFADILLKKKSLVDGILEIFCSYGDNNHLIQFCSR